MIQREIPDRECFKLRISSLDAALVLMVQLGQAGRHLAASRSRRGDDDEWTRSLDIVISPEAFVADDIGDIGRIPGDRIVAVDPHAKALEFLLVGNRRRLVVEAGQDNAAHKQPEACEGIRQPQDVHVVGNAEISPDFVFLDVSCVDDNDDLCLILQLSQHRDLGVRVKARKNPGGVEIIKQFAAEFQVKLAAELADPLPDMLRLNLQVLLIVKSDLHLSRAPMSETP